VKRIRQFTKESWSELKKVSWPNRVQVRNLTVLVFVISFITGLYITIADTVFTEIVKVLAGLSA
jgi:preprotein translocase SecE subunit